MQHDDFFPSPTLGDGSHRPRMWFGCDTNSEAWRAYCEAWTLHQRYSDVDKQELNLGGHLVDIARKRSKEAAAALKHNFEVVGRDLLGLIAERSNLPEMLR